MALTFSRDTPRGGMPVGNMKLVIGRVTFDASYPTGGEAYTPSLFGLQKIIRLVPFPANGYVPEDDKANQKIKMYYADYDAVADAALIEVANATNLSAVTITVMVWGY